MISSNSTTTTTTTTTTGCTIYGTPYSHTSENKELKLIAYSKALCRPVLLDNAIELSDPHTNELIDQLELVQNRAMRFIILNIWGVYYSTTETRDKLPSYVTPFVSFFADIIKASTIMAQDYLSHLYPLLHSHALNLPQPNPKHPSNPIETPELSSS